MTTSGVRRSRKVTISEVMEWRELYTRQVDPWGMRRIADYAERSISTISRHLHCGDVEIRPVGLTLRHPVRCLSQQQIRETIELRVSGLTLREVGERLGIAESTVYSRLRSAGVATPEPPVSLGLDLQALRRASRISSSVESRIVELHDEGRHQREIAELACVNYKTVRSVVLRNGRKLRGRSAGVKRAYELRCAGESGKVCPESYQEPVDLEKAARVDPRPLAQVFDREILARVNGLDEDAVRGNLCELAGLDPRSLFRWRHESHATSVDRAERALRALGVMWWEVYDPAICPGLFSSRRAVDVVAWCEAALKAAEAWGDV